MKHLLKMFHKTMQITEASGRHELWFFSFHNLRNRGDAMVNNTSIEKVTTKNLTLSTAETWNSCKNFKKLKCIERTNVLKKQFLN